MTSSRSNPDHHGALRDGAEIRVCPLEETERIPNNPDRPLLLYLNVLALSGDDAAATAEEVLNSNGWGNAWRDGIFSYHHYHSTAHEVLVVARGEAEVLFGGDHGITVTLRAGDAALLPAGTGHKNLGSSPDLLVVGAYPPNQSPDLLRGRPGERPAADDAIRSVPDPEADPLYGEGPMQAHWFAGSSS